MILTGLVTKFLAGKSLKIGALLVSLSVAFGGGYYVKSQFAEAARAEALSDSLRQQKKALIAVQSRYQALRLWDAHVIDELREREASLNEEYNYVKSQINKNVADNRDCDITVGAVGLLNHARTGSAATDNMSGAAEIPDEESRAPSTITQRTEIQYHADCGIRYRKLMEKHNALIKWLEQERVNSN